MVLQSALGEKKKSHHEYYMHETTPTLHPQKKEGIKEGKKREREERKMNEGTRHMTSSTLQSQEKKK